MAISRTEGQFRLREDIFSNITPKVGVQKDVQTPAGKFKPAAWLPIVFTKTDHINGEDAFVISAGKVVALDGEGRVVPAGLRAALVGSAAGDTVLTYTSDDVNYGVTDLVTGEALTASTSYTNTEVANALLERGLVSTDVPSAVPVTTHADIRLVIEDFISEAIGVAAYDVYVYAGTPEDGDQVFLNYNKQPLIQILTELEMRMPYRTATTATDAFDTSTITTVTAVSGDGDFPVAGEVWEETALDDVTRWASEVDGLSVVALALSNRPVASNTSRTEISCDTSGILENEKSSLSLVKSEGDWYLDAEVGVIFIHSDAWATQVAAGATFQITYYHYDTASTTGASSDRYVFFNGEAKPGARVSYDEHSNFCVMADSLDALGTSNTQSIGRILYVYQEPRDSLSHVKTAWNISGVSASSKMPGSATSGYSDLITLPTDEAVADKVVVINLKVN